MQIFHIFLELDLFQIYKTLTLKMTSVGPLTNSKYHQIESIEKNIAKKHIVCGSTMFSAETIAI